MRLSLVIGNWKMNLTVCEAQALATSLIKPLAEVKNVEIAVCPPFPFIPEVVRALVGTKIEVGAQNVSWEEKGAFTGEVSALMLESLVKFVIIGHSERRIKLGETDGMVNWKVLTCLKNNLIPVLCVGENLEIRESGKTNAFITAQVTEALRTVQPDQLIECVIAYEPIWAIGTGKSAKSAEAEEGSDVIRETLTSLYSQKDADKVRVLYGGSVNAKNAGKLLKANGVDGFLVGKSSLQVQEYVGICKAVEMARSSESH